MEWKCVYETLQFSCPESLSFPCSLLDSFISKPIQIAAWTLLMPLYEIPLEQIINSEDNWEAELPAECWTSALRWWGWAAAHALLLCPGRAGMPKGSTCQHETQQPSKKSWKHSRLSNWAYSSLVIFQMGSPPTFPSLEILMNYPYCWPAHFPQRAVPVVLMHLLHIHPHRDFFPLHSPQQV